MQNVCPADKADHFAIGITDPVAFALAMLAITSDGPADASDIGPATCAQKLLPGVDPATLSAHRKELDEAATDVISNAPEGEDEPALRSFVTN